VLEVFFRVLGGRPAKTPNNADQAFRIVQKKPSRFSGLRIVMRKALRMKQLAARDRGSV
jgi:hypothetical protein